MAEQRESPAEPRGLGEHARGLASEYAHEQGWQLNDEERRNQSVASRDMNGGTDYDYGARDFGDEPVNTASVTAGEQVEQAREQLRKED